MRRSRGVEQVAQGGGGLRSVRQTYNKGMMLRGVGYRMSLSQCDVLAGATCADNGDLELWTLEAKPRDMTIEQYEGTFSCDLQKCYIFCLNDLELLKEGTKLDCQNAQSEIKPACDVDCNGASVAGQLVLCALTVWQSL